MVNKFVFVIAGIVVVMAVLIALPNVMQPAQDITIKYDRQNVTRTDGTFVATYIESLTIARDGSATYSGYDPRLQSIPQEERFTLSNEEFGRIKALVLETGFMDIPTADYLQSDDAGEFTKYALVITTADGQKTFNWVNPEAHEGTIPPIVLNVGAQLDQIASRRA